MAERGAAAMRRAPTGPPGGVGGPPLPVGRGGPAGAQGGGGWHRRRPGHWVAPAYSWLEPPTKTPKKPNGSSWAYHRAAPCIPLFTPRFLTRFSFGCFALRTGFAKVRLRRTACLVLLRM